MYVEVFIVNKLQISVRIRNSGVIKVGEEKVFGCALNAWKNLFI